GWTALVTGQGAALLHPSIGEDQVRGVWSALTAGTGVSGCLEVLAADGLAGLPSFALVQHGDGELRVLVRGEVQVAAAEQVVGAAGIATWREILVPAETYRIGVADDGAAGPGWPISAGVVLAAGIERWGAGRDGTGAAEVGLGAADAAERELLQEEGPEALATTSEADEPVPAPVPHGEGDSGAAPAAEDERTPDEDADQTE